VPGSLIEGRVLARYWRPRDRKSQVTPP